jgi:hypothetical protein
MNLPDKTADILEKYNVKCSDAKGLMTDLMQLTLDYHAELTPKPIGETEVARRLQAFKNGEDPLDPDTGRTR